MSETPDSSTVGAALAATNLPGGPVEPQASGPSPPLTDGAEAHGSLTPMVVVVYLAIYLLWLYLYPYPTPRQPIFFSESVDCAFLLVLAVILVKRGKGHEVRQY